MPTDVAPGVRYWTRSELGLRAPRGEISRVAGSRRTHKVVHYSTGEELGRADTRDWWREIQAFHQGPQRGWADVGYGHGVDVFGNVFEGRGWLAVGAHSPGYNTVGEAICFLGDDDAGVQDVSEAARRALQWWAQEADRRAGKALTAVGHRQTQRLGYTQCPGDELVAFVASGFTAGIGGGFVPPVAPGVPVLRPTPRPGPVVHVPKYLGLLTQPPVRRSRAALLWQTQMARRGWKIAVDGWYGPGSEDVCRRFQKEKGLTVDGKVGPKTWAAAWTSRVT